MAGGTDVDIHWALSCLTLMSFDSAAEFQVTEAPAVSDSVCVLLRSALNFIVSVKSKSEQQLHPSDVGPLPIFAEKSESHKATVTATAICDVCSIIIHNLSLLPANHGPLSSLQCSIALLSACANAHLCPAVALRSVNVLAALVRAGALHAIDPVRWARAVEGLAAYSVGRAVTGHVDPDVLEFSFKSPDTVVGCVGLTASAHTDSVDVAAASLNLIIVAATSGASSVMCLNCMSPPCSCRTAFRTSVCRHRSRDFFHCARCVCPCEQRQCSAIKVMPQPCQQFGLSVVGSLCNVCNAILQASVERTVLHDCRRAVSYRRCQIPGDIRTVGMNVCFLVRECNSRLFVQLLQAMACCLETPGCQMAVMKLAME